MEDLDTRLVISEISSVADLENLVGEGANMICWPHGRWSLSNRQ